MSYSAREANALPKEKLRLGSVFDEVKRPGLKFFPPLFHVVDNLIKKLTNLISDPYLYISFQYVTCWKNSSASPVFFFSPFSIQPRSCLLRFSSSVSRLLSPAGSSVLLPLYLFHSSSSLAYSSAISLNSS